MVTLTKKQKKLVKKITEEYDYDDFVWAGDDLACGMQEADVPKDVALAWFIFAAHDIVEAVYRQEEGDEA